MSKTNHRSSLGQFPVADLPVDAISSLKFSPQPNSLRFAVSSWDKYVYLYEVTEGKTCTLLAKYEHRAPVLDVCFGKDDNELYSACLDWDVRRYVVHWLPENGWRLQRPTTPRKKERGSPTRRPG